MITLSFLLRRLALVVVALLWMPALGDAQISVQSGAQNAWNYTGVYAAYPSPSADHRCVVATVDGVYVGAYYSASALWFIEKYDNAGAFVMKFPKGFTRITGLAASASGDTIYGFDGALGVGYAFSATGAQKFQFGSGYGSNAAGYFNGTYRDDVYNAIAVNSQGKIYAVDLSNYRIQFFNPNGSYGGTFGVNGSLPGQFTNYPAHIAVGPNDEVLVIDWNANLTKFSPSGEYISKAPSTYYNLWNRAFSMSRDGQLMVGVWGSEPWGVLVDVSTMTSDFWQADQWIDSSRAGTAYASNAVSRDNYSGCHGAAFDPAGNLWVTSYNSVTSGSYSLERFERRMRFDTYKPLKPVLSPSVLGAVQQPGKQILDITYRVDMGSLTGGILTGGTMTLTGGTTASGTLVGGTLLGGSVSSGRIAGGSVTTALIGWLNGIKNWSHIVVPTIGSQPAATGTTNTTNTTNGAGMGTAISAGYFWSDMYDPSTRIDNRPPVSDNIQQCAVDTAGNVYVTTDYCVRKITPSGNVSTFAGAVWASAYIDDVGVSARFGDPRGVCVDGNGNVYIAEYNGRVIRKITSAGVVSTLAGSWNQYDRVDGVGANARFRTPNYLACDTNNNVYVTQWDDQYIRKITSSGSVTTVGFCGTYPRGIAVDAQGAMYVADFYGNKILKIVPDGTINGTKTVFAGSGVASHLDGTGAAATFYNPSGVSIDAGGNLYVTESENYVRKVSPAGVVATVGQTSSFVYNAAVDGLGNLYVAETSTQLGSGRMVRKGALLNPSAPGIASSAGVLGAGVQTGSLITVSWDISKDLPGLNFAKLSFEVLAKDDRPEIGAHFVTIPGDANSNLDLRISNNPVSEASLSDLWVWLLARRDPRIAISGNSITFTQAGLDYVADATPIYDASADDKATLVVHTGGTGGADGGWGSWSWGYTTNRGRAFAYKLMNWRPVTGAEITRVSAGRFNINSVDHYSAVNLAQ